MDDDFTYGELIDDTPVTPTIQTNSTNGSNDIDMKTETQLEWLRKEFIKQEEADFRIKAQLIKQGEDLELPPENYRTGFSQGAG